MLTPLHGLSMALADSVPGISGGTIAFILGFYDKFITSLHDLVGKDKQKRKQALVYLIKFALGWGVGLLSCILLLSSLFETHVYFLSSLFLGLTTIAIPIVAVQEKECLKGKYINLLFTAFGIALVVGLTLSRAYAEGMSAIDFTALKIWQYFYLFFVGAVAITAMVLPGISGSTILLIAGVYLPVLDAVKTLVSFNFSVLPGILCFGFGIIVGILLAVRFIRLALEKHRSGMVYFILGLMIGSLVAIVYGPTTLTVPQAALSFSTFNVWAFLLGVLILLGLEFLKRFREKKKMKE